VLSALYLVTLKEVVRAHLYFQKPVAQSGLSFNAVINAAQQDRLIVYRDTTPQQTVTCLGRFWSYLPDMVEMRIKPYRAVLGQHTTQFIVYALGQHYREPGADTDNFDVLYVS
jgi:hypothetical protein